VNLKARYSPCVVVDPLHVAIDCYAGEIIRERSMFPWWNHGPVSQQIPWRSTVSRWRPARTCGLVSCIAWRATASSCGSGKTRRRSERSFHSMRRSERDHHFFDAHGPRRRLNVRNGSGS
jgi:hypothetical protein